MNKILAIGLRTNQEKNIFSGQSMMFDALIEFLHEEKIDVTIIDLTSRYTNLQVGKFSIKRIFEYFVIFLGAFKSFVKCRGGLLYITTAQTKAGFLRDIVFVNLALIFNYKILAHQFGSNFGNFYNSLSPFFRYLIRNTFNRVSSIVVEGEFTKRQFSMLEDYLDKVVSVTNGLPEKILLSSDKGKSYSVDQPFNLIFLSYMIESKGYWDVLKAMEMLVNLHKKNVCCVFAGMFKHSVDAVLHDNEISSEKAFHLYIIENALQSNVSYCAGLMGEAKAQAFLKANVFLLPTYFKFEGQPVSVLEAMAYGAVPVVTNYRMIPNMVSHEAGLFVTAKSPEQIVKKILYLMENPDIYSTYSQASVDRYLANFTLDRYNARMLQVIKKIIGVQ